jgi:parvulin-like peptidyl-prolyl isomerase
VLLAGASGCAALASSPPWVGGGMAVSAPLREAEEDARDAKQTERIAKEPKEIGAKHILVMHSESKSKPENVTRSREEARKRAQESLVKIRGGADFDEMVREYSDEPGAGERNGDLGVFDRSVMIKTFSDVAFALKVGEVSEVVETPFGFHIIKRTE